MFTVRPIGVVRSPFTEKRSAPRQPAAARDVVGRIELTASPGMEHAACDLESCTHLWVVFWFHEAHDFRPKVLPPRSAGERRGVLATRSPHRPNPIGLSVVRLDRVEGLTLHIRDVDMLDGTPVLDVKPYVPYTDSVPEARVGWLTPLVEDEAPPAEDAGARIDGAAPIEAKTSARDPERGFEVVFEGRALAALEVLRVEFGVDLEASIRSVLVLGPQPHPYRRIRKVDGGLVLAVKDWRARFAAEGRRIRVTSIETGYRPRQLFGDERTDTPESALAAHRAVWERFGGG
ncbi:MAG: tRNA (N6-threonylcarbamoyladenosine(37)-N6)-methyltransferase TrmO [Polyangiaceae bacterium]